MKVLAAEVLQSSSVNGAPTQHAADVVLVPSQARHDSREAYQNLCVMYNGGDSLVHT